MNTIFPKIHLKKPLPYAIYWAIGILFMILFGLNYITIPIFILGLILFYLIFIFAFSAYVVSKFDWKNPKELENARKRMQNYNTNLFIGGLK